MVSEQQKKQQPVMEQSITGTLPKPKLDISTFQVILWNLVPVMGVVFGGWKPESVFICYAMETVVIGGFNVLKMLVINYSRPPAERNSALLCLGIILFFLLHYYFIVFIQLYMFFQGSQEYDGVLQAVFMLLDQRSYNVALGTFAVNKAISFFNVFIQHGEYRKRTMGWQMWQPYNRLFIQQPVVILGGFLFDVTGNAWPVLIIFVAVKIFVDLIPSDIGIGTYHYRNYTDDGKLMTNQ